MSYPLVPPVSLRTPNAAVSRPAAPPLTPPLAAGPIVPLDQAATAPAPNRPPADARFVVSGQGDSPAMIDAYARFVVDPKTSIVSISIINAATNAVIRQIPPEEVLELARMMQEQAERFGQPPVAAAVMGGGQGIDQRI